MGRREGERTIPPSLTTAPLAKKSLTREEEKLYFESGESFPH
jgi:hypothetical protein